MKLENNKKGKSAFHSMFMQKHNISNKVISPFRTFDKTDHFGSSPELIDEQYTKIALKKDEDSAKIKAILNEQMYLNYFTTDGQPK